MADPAAPGRLFVSIMGLCFKGRLGFWLGVASRSEGLVWSREVRGCDLNLSTFAFLDCTCEASCFFLRLPRASSSREKVLNCFPCYFVLFFIEWELVALMFEAEGVFLAPRISKFWY